MTSKREMPHAHFGYISLRWQDDAACASTDVEAFYFDAWEKRPAELTLLKRMCAHCPVQDACLQYALQTNEQYGVWGGLTPDERRLLRRRQRRTA